MTLPSGRVVSYTYNTYLPITVKVGTTTILSAASYDPIGSARGWTWGNSTAHSRSFDLRGLLDGQSMVTDTRTLDHDDAGRLVALDDARHDLSFEYDPQGRLTEFTASCAAPLPPSQDFSYDENANRESLTESNTTYDYYLISNSKRLPLRIETCKAVFSYRPELADPISCHVGEHLCQRPRRLSTLARMT